MKIKQWIASAVWCGVLVSSADDETCTSDNAGSQQSQALLQGAKMTKAKLSTAVDEKQDYSDDLAGLRNSTMSLLEDGATPEVIAFAEKTIKEIETNVEKAIASSHATEQKLVDETYMAFSKLQAKYELDGKEFTYLGGDRKKISAQHLECRGTQKDFCGDHTKCRTEQAALQLQFDDAKKEYKADAADVGQCDGDPTSLPIHAQRKHYDEYIKTGKVYFDLHKKLADKIAQCDKLEAKLKEHTLKCDGIKQELEAAACATHDHYASSYNALQSGWSVAQEHYADVKAAVSATAKDRQREFQGLADVKCILAAVKERGGRPCKDGDKPGEADEVIKRCSKEASDVSHLVINFKDEPAKPLPMEGQSFPCTNEFIQEEYGTLTGDCFADMPACKACNEDNVLTFETMCVSARGDNPHVITIPEDTCISKIEFKHKNAPSCKGSNCKVSCRKAASGDSKWGCDSDSIGLIIADGSEVVAPVFDVTEGLTPHYHSHAHWYKIDGVNKNSDTMEWVFKEPLQLPAKSYKLWYNEDLTGGTEGDNRGSACYDVTIHKAKECEQLAPLQFHKVCVGAEGDRPGSIELPEHTCVTEIDHYYTTGSVSCSGDGGKSNFGCGDLEALVWTEGGSKDILMPTVANTEGITRTGHKHAHWYHIDGVSRNSRLLEMKLKEAASPLVLEGKLNLWYNEDLSGGTESDNKGTACYDVAVHRAKSCSRTEFKNVCVHARGDKPSPIELRAGMCVDKVEITHKSGRVSCRKQASGDSNWGCDSNSVGLIIADGQEVVAPVFDVTKGLTPHYHSHAHWYKLDGVNRDSKKIVWDFKEPYQMEAKEYKLWYNEDLTGGTEGDNRGSACYDIKFHRAETCNNLAPLQYNKVCVSAAGDKPGSIQLPEHTCVTEIDHYYTTGKVSCAGDGGKSNFGCGDLEALVWTEGGSKDIYMPLKSNTEGITRTGHKHAHWYHIDGVTRNSRLLEMRLKQEASPMILGGIQNLWYNEDLSGGTESDNKGTACYDVAVHRAKECKKLEFNNICVSAKGNKPASIELSHDTCVSKIELTYKSGRVSCRAAASGESNWGCDGNSIGLVLADDAEVVAPVFDVTKGLTPEFKSHAHWYTLDGVNRDSKQIDWTFTQPYTFSAQEYHLWYNEDLTGGTEGDNRGSACYDVKFHEASGCRNLPPLQFHKVCTSARGDKPGSITLPDDTCVTEIDIYYSSGSVSCAGDGGKSNFGCGDLEGLVWTKKGRSDVLLPRASNTVGLTRTGHKHAHWYHIEGVKRNSRLLEMKVKPEVGSLKLSGELSLWYNEDLTGGTEGDNKGTACYEVAVHRAESCM